MPSLSGIDLVIDQRLGANQNFSSSAISFIQGGGIYFDVAWEWNNGCCNASRDKRHAKDILDGLGITASGVILLMAPITQPAITRNIAINWIHPVESGREFHRTNSPLSGTD